MKPVEVASIARPESGEIQSAYLHPSLKPALTGNIPLRDKQARILEFIREFTSLHCYPPTIREITNACNISSTSVTDYNLRQLEKRNYLTRKRGIARSIVLTDLGQSWMQGLPDTEDP